MGAGANRGHQQQANNSNNNNNPPPTSDSIPPYSDNMFSNVSSSWRNSRMPFSSRMGNPSKLTTSLNPCQRCYTAISKLKRKKMCTECTGLFCDNCLDTDGICKICSIILSTNKATMNQIKIRDLKRFLKAKCVVTERCREKSELIDLCMRYMASVEEESPLAGGAGFESARTTPTPAAIVSRNFSSYYYDSPNIIPDPDPELLESEHDIDVTSPPTSARRHQQSVLVGPSSVEDVLTPVETPTPTCTVTSPAITAIVTSPVTNTTPSVTTATSPNTTVASPVTTAATTTALTTQPIEQEQQVITVDDDESEVEDEDVEVVFENTQSADVVTGGVGGEATAVGGPSRPHRASITDISSLSDIESLTTRQCKEILANNFVDYKGCCEKWELKQRVRRLYDEHTKTKSPHQPHTTHNAGVKVGHGSAAAAAADSSDTDRDVCKICMDAPVDCVLLECGHMLTCTKCGKRLAECPICRQYVVRVVHTFKA